MRERCDDRSNDMNGVEEHPHMCRVICRERSPRGPSTPILREVFLPPGLLYTLELKGVVVVCPTIAVVIAVEVDVDG